MGEHQVNKITNTEEKTIYIDQLLKDIEALDHMLKQGMFENQPIHIGAEQEFCLVNDIWEPSDLGVEILAEIKDKHFTSELNRYNLELNLDPVKLEGTSFSDLHDKLNELMEKAKEAAAKHDAKIILTGILPTVSERHLDYEYMTPVKRYVVLNDAIKSIRQDDIELHIKGVDEVNLHHDTILYEGCNTSFQSHLQIDPSDFMDTYNWAQAIAGPVLSICTNSPLLIGKELWEETRIALFTQSVDTRASTFILNEKESRVGFGNDWVTGTITDFYKEAVVNFRSLITTTFETDSMAQIKKGEIPKLTALSLHNGTTYRWNRLCYGITNGAPHVRIENRYIPSGPTTEDEIANMMFWVGLMHGRPKELDAIHEKMDFKDIKSNFFNAARYGMAAQFYWDGKLISSQNLLLDHFLPMAYRGLYSMDVAPKDAEHYLSVIERRIRTNSGSRWMVNAFRKLTAEKPVPEALKSLVATMYERQEKKYTIDAWRLPRGDEFETPEDRVCVGDRMSTKIITAQNIDSLELVLKMMLWRDIHHTPILNNNLDLVGLLTWTDVQKYLGDPKLSKQGISDIMQKEVITAHPDMLLEEAKNLMIEKNIGCLPVMKEERLIGIITSNDL
ncbi:MAG: CBS domain-containing protein [Muriicola sp.]|nr:CBS domain-containing protein [Muriicola sp.]